MTPAKSGPPAQRRASRFWRISSLTVRNARSATPYGDCFRAPNVCGSDFILRASVGLVVCYPTRGNGDRGQGNGLTATAGTDEGKGSGESCVGMALHSSPDLPWCSMSPPTRDYRDLIAWQRAMDFAILVDQICGKLPRKHWELSSQLRR